MTAWKRRGIMGATLYAKKEHVRKVVEFHAALAVAGAWRVAPQREIWPGVRRADYIRRWIQYAVEHGAYPRLP